MRGGIRRSAGRRCSAKERRYHRHVEQGVRRAEKRPWAVVTGGHEVRHYNTKREADVYASDLRRDREFNGQRVTVRRAR